MNDYFYINIKDVNLKLVLHNVETFKKHFLIYLSLTIATSSEVIAQTGGTMIE